MTLRPLDLVPGDDDAVEESLPVRLPAGLPAETRQALEFALEAAAQAVLAGRVRVTGAPDEDDRAELAFDVRQSELPDALAEPARAAAEPGRAERRAAMVARIREANAETLERLKDL
ncbi:hypothetical protein [Streptomyces sp. CB01881]|uniref:hypothetical protein n=1 Tax=Streptomyces sp. CB01881 TaxID=2078691 RepID=UPI000CDC387E|nr:hypothetical protein [Streptomyces sp. CB01881]AUY51995.1 hypothetical protein C2142_27215 [Streptomyces sp. CB01881]TYC71425.1 hypothetical protein EH183_27200 [Streptomyces sp. CB01881]